MTIIHPTAIVDTSANLSDSVEIGAFSIIEANVEIGPGTVIRPHAVIRQYTVMGQGNFVDSFAVLGGLPQDFKFIPSTVSYLRIGDNNTFREGVTISRATTEGKATTVGNNTFWMTNSHCGHDSTVQDEAVIVNGSLVAGHCTIGRRSILPANGAIHQFCWIGEGVMFQAAAKIGMHVPPYVICTRDNNVLSLNSIGLRRRTDISINDRKQIKEAFHITYLSNLPLKLALAEMDSHEEWGKAAGRFREFVRQVLKAKKPFNRGLCPRSSRINLRRNKVE